MAGSQLKKLKATLKEAGLTGQTNVKQKGKRHSRKTPSDTRRDDRAQVISRIREQFNPFEVRKGKTKFEVSNGRSVGVAKPSVSKQVGEQQRRAAYDVTKSRRNKVGGVIDRRFGENDKNMTPEEKMLERFTRERQSQTSKNSLYNLEDDDGSDNDGITLTHYGKSLSLGDNNEDNEDGDGDGFTIVTEKRQLDEETVDQPSRKRTKAEVMQEVIAKSKFYKQQRKLQHEKDSERIMDLDDEFEDILGELKSMQNENTNDSKAPIEDETKYDETLRALNLDRRAVPADRTKTEEEIVKEREEKMQKLEQDRQLRMQGMDVEKTGEGDELDDTFWAGSDEEVEELGDFVDGEKNVPPEEYFEESSSEGTTEKIQSTPSESVTITIGNKKVVSQNSSKKTHFACPETHEQFLHILIPYKVEEHLDVIKRILNLYQPRLAEGNKEKLGVFSTVILGHFLYLADLEEPVPQSVIEGLMVVLREMASKYNEPLTQAFRSELKKLGEKLDSDNVTVKLSDLLLFTVIGYVYSTSDMYHLVVNPTVILITEVLETLDISNIQHLLIGTYLADLLYQFQSLSKRIIPEVNRFLERSIISLCPEPEKLDYTQLYTATSHIKPSGLNLQSNSKLASQEFQLTHFHEASVDDTPALLEKLLQIVDKFTLIWKEKSSFVEISVPFITLSKHSVKYYASDKLVVDLLGKLNQLYKVNIKEHRPLKLQAHRAISIMTNTPKFEENFNPDKKSYDPNRDRQELNKLRSQFKKERKLTLKELRKDTRFTAREQIKEKKKQQEEYHARMAYIYNSISTEEGADKNQYDREKKMRKKGK
ncbi:Maturation and nuclear export of 40S ribosomal subunits interacting protein [Komagataella phaffii CBS 7435]|uniref:Nucleolar protein, forms a complex with Noc4p n=2 Tax=Komagataella phaffii TaxID=460519 RepID=C4R842_KOMPG|nr:Nucleolar protein, forms a complex with Noc4p [Komagataella phaffii GS115]AOA64740.1 GQ67_04878T0 [Komagataella phaffii]CAH2450842.1 Maturation and nuclear export of 40S ribosomal subunits interacting protein [Komagataella phaffii CBS 7435]AOA70353.1 GQ68_04850T0 [Komagataella phaffii GS115]CAY71767.1 Nucleolar protein, forms a complex with Noc4p [Komagataella phaffii GS115]CCA40632.1 Maturation and nuclear export of 40S ribosomal subunits interacting protein [Komagataella phaffii CBS 7435]